MKKVTPVVLMLLGAPQALAEQKDKEVWITIGAEAIEPMRAAFRSAEWEAPLLAQEKGDVAVVRVRESQLPRIAEVMHEKFNRCAGFIAHDSQEAAIAALAPAPKVEAPQSLVSYTLNNATQVNALMAQLLETNVRSTITSLSSYSTRYYTSQGGVDAANWLRTKWQGYATGRGDVTVELFQHTGWAQPSVILTIRGTTLPNEVVVVGGHLDSISSGSTAPGADDDASGVASFTEVIRAAMVTNYRPARTVKFMAYAAEEVGLRGSKEIATWHKNNGINVVGVLQLDMTNYRGSSVDVGILTDYTNSTQNQFLRNLIDTYVKITWSNTSCGYGCSDHVSWTNAGFAASMPFESLMNQSNPYIHTTSDTLTRSAGVATHALKFSKIAAAFVAELGEGTVGLTATP